MNDEMNKDYNPAYLQALEDSLKHHEDGVNGTEETYKYFDMSADHCAICKYHGYSYDNDSDCDACFLKDPDGVCCVEWHKAITAKHNGHFEAFHTAEVALCDRIRKERDRVKAIQDAAKQTLPQV